jgi:hypothetical protein
MRPTTHADSRAASTVLCASCLALLLVAYIAIAIGIAGILRVELQVAARSYLVRF